MKIKILKYGFQRNGIMGEPFHWFEVLVDGENILVATLTVSCDPQGNERPDVCNWSCRVMDPFNLESCWRGDEFEREIRAQYTHWWGWPVVSSDPCGGRSCDECEIGGCDHGREVV